MNEQSPLKFVDIVVRWHGNLFVLPHRWEWLAIFINHSECSFRIRYQLTVIVNSVTVGSKTLALVVCWVVRTVHVNKINFPSTCDVIWNFGTVKVHQNEHQRIAVDAIAYPNNSAETNSWQHWGNRKRAQSPITLVELPILGETLNPSC
jgi:hypothetical protein